MKIEFLYFDGCPSWIPALQNLKAVVSETFQESEIRLIHIRSVEDAERHNFQGSPSIRVDGSDMEGKDEGYGYKCRLYEEDGRLSGVPSTELIQKCLNRLSDKQKSE